MKKLFNALIISLMLCFSLSLTTVRADVNYKFSSGNYHVVYIKNNSISTTCNNVATVTYDESNIEFIKSFDIYDDLVHLIKQCL